MKYFFMIGILLALMANVEKQKIIVAALIGILYFVAKIYDKVK